MAEIRRIQVIDSHTGGEPTRLVVAGGPPLGDGPLALRLARFRSHFDHYRSAIVEEPRGSEAVVGALLCQPFDRSCDAGVIFFNNVGYLGMCGHGTIGLAATLAFLDRMSIGAHRIETPVGVVEVELHSPNQVTVSNVASYRLHQKISIAIEGFGRVTGDVAWGGNWFFLTEDCPLPLSTAHLSGLTTYALKVRHALALSGITGTEGAEIDHIELHGAAVNSQNHSRNFVLCPGGSYDRSPCGTGTSAKLACLHADGHLQEGEIWRQESVIGSVFEGSFLLAQGALYPRIKGSAFVISEASLLIDPGDPFGSGIPKTE